MIAVYILAGFAGELLLALLLGRVLGMHRTIDSLITERFQAEAWAAMTPGQRRALMRLVGSEISPVALARAGDGPSVPGPSLGHGRATPIAHLKESH